MPPRMPLSSSTWHRPPTASTTSGSAVDAGRRAVELPAAVVGHHHRVRAEADRPPRVARVQHPLHHQRQARPARAATPGPPSVSAGANDARRCARRSPTRPGAPECARLVAAVGEVGRDHVGGQRERVAQVAQPAAEHRHVHGDHQRPAAGRVGPVQQVGDQRPVAQPVELEPDRPRRSAAICSIGRAAQRAGHVRHARPRRPPRPARPRRPGAPAAGTPSAPPPTGIASACRAAGRRWSRCPPRAAPGAAPPPVQRAPVARRRVISAPLPPSTKSHTSGRQHRPGPLGEVGQRHGRQVGQHRSATARRRARRASAGSSLPGVSPNRSPAGTPRPRPAPAGRRRSAGHGEEAVDHARRSGSARWAPRRRAAARAYRSPSSRSGSYSAVITSAGGRPVRSSASSGDASGSAAVGRVGQVVAPVPAHRAAVEQRRVVARRIDAVSRALVGVRVDQQLARRARARRVAGQQRDRGGQVAAGAVPADRQPVRVDAAARRRARRPSAAAAWQSCTAAGKGAPGRAGSRR